MLKSVCIGTLVFAAALCAGSGTVQAVFSPESRARAIVPARIVPAAQQTAPAAGSSQRALLDAYCVTCHNQRMKAGNLLLDTVDVTKVASNSETWEKVVSKLRAGMMPPPGNRRPEPAQHEAFVSWL